MSPTLQNRAVLIGTAILTLALPRALSSQLIQVRTVPVATGDQFLLVPSSNLGMAGVRFAVADSLADGWSNPAKGAMLGASGVYSSPATYAIGRGGGHGVTLPFSALVVGERWFGGGMVAIQDVDNELDRVDLWRFSDPPRLSEVSSRNLYAASFVGRRLGESPWSVGIGATVSDLQAMDGVDLLYGGALHLDQSGSVSDVRMGLYREDGLGRLSLTVARNMVDMEHIVTYRDVVWPDVDWDTIDHHIEPAVSWRREINLDRTNAWGVQLEWDRALEAAPGWRYGLSLTANRKSHPKIPNYNIQNIPRDPGNSTAFELGVGLARTRGASTFAVDVALQPIWSDTWQEAEEHIFLDVDDPGLHPEGAVILKGGRTIENEFVFLNAQLRVGFSHQFDEVRVQGGIEGRSYSYSLEQVNNIESTIRNQEESWMEWTPAASALVAFDGFDLQYGVRFTTGTGHPGTDRGGGFLGGVEAANSPGNDFVTAPEGPLTLAGATVVTQQIWIGVPIH